MYEVFKRGECPTGSACYSRTSPDAREAASTCIQMVDWINCTAFAFADGVALVNLRMVLLRGKRSSRLANLMPGLLL